MTSLFLTRPLKAHALSSPVGSGKSYAAARYLARPDMALRNVLYVAPTIALTEQVQGDLRRAAAATPGAVVRNVNLIHSENRSEDDGRSTKEAALADINAANEGDGHVLVLTTGTFLAILSQITHPERWAVILDEAFSPISLGQFKLGRDPMDSWSFFRELFGIEADEGHRIVPAAGMKEAVGDIAVERYGRTGEKFASLSKVARAVANPAMRCELVMTKPVETLLRGETPEPTKSKGKTDDIAETVLEFAAYVAPEFFLGFREVIFLCALFEETILYHLWTKALGVTFEDHPKFPKEDQRDTHAEQGRFLAVGHLLHETDTASKENLTRNMQTGRKGETRKGARVLDHLVQTAAAYFGPSRFLLQVNAQMGYGPESSLTPATATMIPAFAYGLNSFQGVDNVVALCVTNPTPQERAWVRERTGMSSKEVGQSYRIHATYQALGRCSIRRRVPTSDPKVLLCVGKAEADFIVSKFKGSKALGQVGSMPSLKVLEAKNEAKKPGKTATVAQTILDYLDSLSLNVDRIGSKTVKAALQTTESSLSLREESVTWNVPAQTWKDAVALAVSSGSGWRRQGSSLVRTKAEDYGFATT